MAEVAAIVVSSAAVGGAAQTTTKVTKAGIRQLRQRWDRMRGLSMLKKLPIGLEALVFGDDVTPEMLAALSLGGSPGLELSISALLTTTRGGTTTRGVSAESFEDYQCTLLGEEDAPLSTDAKIPPTRMDGSFHSIDFLAPEIPERTVLVHTFSSDRVLSLKRNDNLVVVGHNFGPVVEGVLVYGLTDGCFYYCENRCGELQCSSVDTCPEGQVCLDVPSTNYSSMEFTVAPGVLDSYSEFFRMCHLLHCRNPRIVELLGLAEVARSLGLRFAAELTGGTAEELLSRTYLRSVVNRLGSGRGPLRMPDDIWDLIREAAKALPFCDRAYERVCFGATQKSTAAYVEVVTRKAETTGNVSARTTGSTHSCLIKSCVVGSLGMETKFAVFPHFSCSRLNIDVSPGCTAMFFPGLNMTVAFPDGSTTEVATRTFRPACPFTSDLSETFGILMDLAPQIGKERLRRVALALSEELSVDPSLVLDPVTEHVVRSFGTNNPGQHSLGAILRTSKLINGRIYGEAAVAGVLCQLGLDFSTAGGDDMRCFFNCCREAGWGKARGNVGQVLVDCKVDVSKCHLCTAGVHVFLGFGGNSGHGYYAEIKGPGVEISQMPTAVNFRDGENYHLEITSMNVVDHVKPTTFSSRCYVGSLRPPMFCMDVGLTAWTADCETKR